MKQVSLIGGQSQAKSAGQDPAIVAKKVETVFLNEFLKVMFEQTSFAKNKTIGSFLPIITGHIADSLAERGVGFGDFMLKNQPVIENSLQMPGSRPANGHRSDLSGMLPQVSGKITSRFGLRLDPIDGKVRNHAGVDIAVPEQTPVRPAAEGKVVFSGYSNGYGNCVILDHGNGYTTLYGHNAQNLVKTGDIIKSGTAIALSGSTGRATGPHIHFEVRKDGVAVDPSGFPGTIG